MLPPIPRSIWPEGRWNQSNIAPTVQTWTSVTGSCSENWSIYSGMKNSTPTRTSPRECSGSQTKWSKFGWQAFLWDAWVKYTTVSDPKLPKKHDTVNHFGPSQMVLELISLRQSFPNNLIYQRNENKCNVYTTLYIVYNELLYYSVQSTLCHVYFMWYTVIYSTHIVVR